MRKLLLGLLLVSYNVFAGPIQPSLLTNVNVTLGEARYFSSGKYWVQSFVAENNSTNPNEVVVMLGLNLSNDDYFQVGSGPGGWAQVQTNPIWDGTYRTRPVPWVDLLPTTYDIVWDTPHNANGIHPGESMEGFNVRINGTLLPDITEWHWFAVMRDIDNTLTLGGGSNTPPPPTKIASPGTLLLLLLGAILLPISKKM